MERAKTKVIRFEEIRKNSEKDVKYKIFWYDEAWQRWEKRRPKTKTAD